MPRLGGPLVAAWPGGIILNLVLVWDFTDADDQDRRDPLDFSEYVVT
jgi:hypothetical protein